MQGKIQIRSNKQIVDKFSKETGIKDPIVDTFIAMQDKIHSLGYYPVEDITIAYSGRKIYGIDPGHYAGWTWGINNKQPSGDIFEEVVGGCWAEMADLLDREINPNKYYDGDWKRVVKEDGEQCYQKVVKRVINNPRGRLRLTGITPW